MNTAVNIQYYDYTEHQTTADADDATQIREMLSNAIKTSSVSIEIKSRDVLSQWLQEERILLRHSDISRRVSCVLERDSNILHDGDDHPSRGRSIEVDFSGGQRDVMASGNHDQASQQYCDTRYFQTQAYFMKCFELALLVRRLLELRAGTSFLRELRDLVTFKQNRAAAAFMSVAMAETRKRITAEA